MVSRRGRPPLGSDLVDSREGEALAKLRLKLILETLSATLSVSEAASVLGVKERAFLKLRERWLEESLQTLEPRRVGRPAKANVAEIDRIRELEAEVDHLKLELRKARASEEIALVLGSRAPGSEGVERGRKRPKRSRT